MTGMNGGAFKKSILEGLEMLNDGHPKGLAGLAPLGVELKYQDGFRLGPDESPSTFLKEKLNFGFSLPSTFLDHSPYRHAVRRDSIGISG